MTKLVPSGSYELTPLSTCVLSKTGTKIEKFLNEYDEFPSIKGTTKTITLGENTTLKKLGVDTVTIHKAHGYEGKISFSRCFDPVKGWWESASFKIGDTSEMKKFFDILRKLPKSEFLKPQLSTIQEMLKFIK